MYRTLLRNILFCNTDCITPCCIMQVINFLPASWSLNFTHEKYKLHIWCQTNGYTKFDFKVAPELRSRDSLLMTQYLVGLEVMTQAARSALAEDLPRFLVDIGANLTHRCFANRELDAVISRAWDAGIQKIMVTGTSVGGSKEALRLTRLYPGKLYATAGVHPHDAKTFNASTLASLEELAANEECVAIGECGLDFNRNFSPQKEQLTAFEAQVSLACKLRKPLFVHERDAHKDLISVFERFTVSQLPPVVIHCFTGTMEEAKVYLNMGFYIGLTGFLWKDKLDNGVQYALKNRLLPLERLMVETDAPFMYPNVFNKKIPKDIQSRISEHSKRYHSFCSFNRNEPCALPAIVDLIAAFMDVPSEDVAFNTTFNAVKVFGLN